MIINNNNNRNRLFSTLQSSRVLHYTTLCQATSKLDKSTINNCNENRSKHYIHPSFDTNLHSAVLQSIENDRNNLCDWIVKKKNKGRYTGLTLSEFVVVVRSHLDGHGSGDTHRSAAIPRQSEVLQRSLAGIMRVVLGKHGTASRVMVPNTSCVLNAGNASGGFGGQGRWGSGHDHWGRGMHRGRRRGSAQEKTKG
jgi:hypothetical protein